MSRIVLLSCTKSKLDKPAPAQELYSPSPTFQKTLEYGKRLKPDKIYILSAKHYLVPLDKKLSPYDLTLKDMKKDEKDKWGKIVAKQMQSSGINLQKDTFISLAGSEYMKPLTDHIPESNIEIPLEGLRMGERMKWLNGKLGKLKEIIQNLKTILHEFLKK